MRQAGMGESARLSRPQSGLLFDKVVGVLTPLCVYIEPGSEILLTNRALAEDVLAFPLSIVLTPFLIGYLFKSEFSIAVKRSLTLSLLILPFIVLCLGLGMYGAATRYTESLLFAGAWILPFLWVPYFITIVNSERFATFCRYFVVGATINLLWYFIPAVLELLLYGSLQDGGRLTQNLIFPGQYQIAVYVPTVTALSAAFINALWISGRISISRIYIISFNILSLLTLFSLSSREGVLVYFATNILLLSTKSYKAIIAVSSALLIASVGIYAGSSNVLQDFEQSEFRIFQRIAKLQEEDARYGGRDEMIREALSVFSERPIFGSMLTPPNDLIFGLGLRAPSAHNMYIDTFVWTGALIGSIYLLIFIVLAANLVKAFLQRDNDRLIKMISAISLVFLLVSNNVNVPMRQPVIAPLAGLLIAISIFISMTVMARPKR